MRGYIAIGHGTEPNGQFDPGATVTEHGRPTVAEHALAQVVVARVASRLAGRVNFDVEGNGGEGHDPDYRGSAVAINAGAYDWAIEVHFDYKDAPRGGMGLWLDTDDLRWCQRIAGQYGKRGVPFRSLERRPGLYLLRGVVCPVVIWECDRVGYDVTPADLVVYGDCIADGTLEFLAWKYPNVNVQSPATNPTSNPTNEGGIVYPQIATDERTGRFWVLTGPDGGIDARGPDGRKESGVYYGNLIDHPEYHAGVDEGEVNGPAVGIGTFDAENGVGYVIYTRDANGEYHPYHFDRTTI